MTYEDVTVRQAQGLACPRCNSLSGHYSVCPFINRATAEAREFVNKAEPTQADVIRSMVLLATSSALGGNHDERLAVL